MCVIVFITHESDTAICSALLPRPPDSEPGVANIASPQLSQYSQHTHLALCGHSRPWHIYLCRVETVREWSLLCASSRECKFRPFRIRFQWICPASRLAFQHLSNTWREKENNVCHSQPSQQSLKCLQIIIETFTKLNRNFSMKRSYCIDTFKFKNKLTYMVWFIIKCAWSTSSAFASSARGS